MHLLARCRRQYPVQHRNIVARCHLIHVYPPDPRLLQLHGLCCVTHGRCYRSRLIAAHVATRLT